VIYIKSNPGNKGTGLVENIHYRNITSKSTIWMPIWIGPQQQQQPGKIIDIRRIEALLTGRKGTGCTFLYPLIPSCPTQPLVTIRNITLENVNLEKGFMLPGVILGDAKNPFTDLHFINVHNDGDFVVQKDYVFENVVNYTQSNTEPPFFQHN